MAKLEVEIASNIGPFERALAKATAKAREFGTQVKEVGTDILKETAGHDLSHMMGVAGAAAAVTAFGVALVEAVHKGLEAYGEFEQRVLKTELNVPGITHEEATEKTEADDKLAGAPGSAAEISSAKLQLREAGLPEGETEAKKAETPSIGGVSGAHMEGNITVLPAVTKAVEQMHTVDSVWQDLANYQIKSGVSQVAAAESIRKLIERSGDTGENMARVITQLPDLDKEIRKRMEVDKQKFLGSLSSEQRKDPTEVKKWQDMEKQTPAEYMKEKGGGTNELLNLVHGLTQGNEVEKYSHTLQGVMADVAAKFEQLNTAIGGALAADFEKYAHEFADALPTMTADITDIAKSVLPAFHDGLASCTKLLDDLYQKFSPEKVINKDVALTTSGKFNPDTDNVNYGAYQKKGETVLEGLWAFRDALWDDISIHVREKFGMTPDLGAALHSQPGRQISPESVKEISENTAAVKENTEAMKKGSVWPSDVE